MRTRVKICGITRAEDAAVVAAAGADAIGLVFYPPSPRAVSIDQAGTVIASLPPFVTTVGLFVDEAAERVAETAERLSLDLLQFHGDEAADYCRSFGRPYLKAVRMAEGVDLERVAADYHDARGLLLDSYRPGVPGGTGHAFDWLRIPSGLAVPIVLAGGLKVENVAEAIATVRPYAVDVSSGVEAQKGIKDHGKIADFMHQVEIADAKR